MRLLTVSLGALVLAGRAWAGAEPPPELMEFTEEQTAFCRDLGGTPSILSGYQTVRDLNGDGRDDFLVNLANLECRDAWSAFCGSAGCPVSAWLSEPGNGYHRFDFGYLQGVEIESGSPLPRVLAGYHGSLCGEADRIGADTCTRTWTFASNDPAEPAIDAPAPSAGASKSAGDAAPARIQAIAPGWTLRNVPGSSPVALGGGTGGIAFLAAFCLGGKPFLAVTFHERPKADAVSLGFAFSQGAETVKASFEEGAGGAFVVPLADGDLSARLGGRDRDVAVTVDGATEGKLSLSGSSRSLRGALAACPVG
ncbi:MAG: hypothetical protein QM699_18260 [Amaricoccus sp.]|uniref:hypothetical protein n=1 Tax=Amaricoccus sp. TaxID=1872485 RepID=UPI0039E294AF